MAFWITASWYTYRTITALLTKYTNYQSIFLVKHAINGMYVAYYGVRVTGNPIFFALVEYDKIAVTT